MAKPTTLTFGDFLIQVETAAGSGVYFDPCGFTSKSDAETAQVVETVVPQCPPDEDDPAFIERDVNSISKSITASGVLSATQFDNWRTWMRSGESRSCKIWNATTLAKSGGYDEGQFVLSSLTKTGNRGEKIQVAVQMDSDGEFAWTNADA